MQPAQLYEVYQGEHTHRSGTAVSRLDRVYTNAPVTDQLNHSFGMAALEWKHHLSHHRAVSYSRSAPASSHTASVPATVLKHSDFSRRVRLEYDGLISDGGASSAIERLTLLQRAMGNVGRRGNWQPAGYQLAGSAEEKLGACLRYIRAAERGNTDAISVSLLIYPDIRQFVRNPYKISGNLAVDLTPLRQHVQDLVRQQALDEIAEAEELERDGREDLAKRRKQHASRLLYKLVPGRVAQLRAVRASDGTVVTEPTSIAQVLRGHWSFFLRSGV